MSIRRKKKLLLAMLAVATGTVLPSATSCIDYGIRSAVTAFNVCAVVNCEQGTYFDPCGATPLFVDCPTTTTTNP